MVENLPVAFIWLPYLIWVMQLMWNTGERPRIRRSCAVSPEPCCSLETLIWQDWLSSQNDITVKKPRTNKYTCFRSRMKWTENNLCLSWILMRGGATVHFASGQLCHGSSKMPTGASPSIVCDQLGIFRCPRSGYFFITCTVHVMYFNVVSFSNIYTRQQFSQMNLFWTNEVHTPMKDTHSCYFMPHISEVTDNWNCWLADVTLDWCHVMETAVGRTTQTRWFIAFLCCLFYKVYIITSQIVNKNDLKCKYKRYCSFFWHSSKYEHNGSHAKLTWRLLCTRSVAFILRWMTEKCNLFLNWHDWTAYQRQKQLMTQWKTRMCSIYQWMGSYQTR